MIRTLLAAFAIAASVARAADYPQPKPGDWIAHDFRFHTGEVMKEVKLHYVTLGDPKNNAILVLHGSGGSSASMRAVTTSSSPMRSAPGNRRAPRKACARSFPGTTTTTWSRASIACSPKASA